MLLLCYGMIVFQPAIVTIVITQKHSYQKIKYYESYHTSKNNYHFRNNPISLMVFTHFYIPKKFLH